MRSLNRYNAHRVRHPATNDVGDAWNGCFVFVLDGVRFFVMASTGGGWDHVSVSTDGRTPHWNEMDRIKRMFFRDDEMAVQIHPPVMQHVNMHDYVLHLWRCQDEQMPKPPMIMV